VISVKRFVSLVLILVLALSLLGCDLLFGHDEMGCAEGRLCVSLEGATLVKDHRDQGYDGSLCYHVFSVPDGFEYGLDYSKWRIGNVPTEALEICEESFTYNGRQYADFPIVDDGIYYYDLFNDGKNERFCLAVLDKENDILYYFFATGQAVDYPDNR
jgi:hypothetical protein